MLDDANIEAAASAGAWGAFFHQGQICLTAGRHLVHERIADAYAEALVRKAKARRSVQRMAMGHDALSDFHPSVLIRRVLFERLATESYPMDQWLGLSSDRHGHQITLGGGVSSKITSFEVSRSAGPESEEPPAHDLIIQNAAGTKLVGASGELEFIGTVMDITDLKRAEEMQIALAHEREMLMRQRAADLAKANEALRSCLDTLASVPELDDFLGQVMVAITNELGGVSSTLRLCNFEKNILNLELVYQEGRVSTTGEAGYPEYSWSWPIDKNEYSCFDQPATMQHVAEPGSIIPVAKRDYLLARGVKTVLVIPLVSRSRAVGRLTFHFVQQRDFSPEELEIAKALASQAALAIQLTRLAKTAKQSAVLEERNQLATEIHDTLAQSFTGISMQLEVAAEQLAAKEGDPLGQIQLANEIAMFGLAEARRSILSLRSDDVEQSGLTMKLRALVERSNVAGRLRCDFRSDNIHEQSVPPGYNTNCCGLRRRRSATLFATPNPP